MVCTAAAGHADHRAFDCVRLQPGEVGRHHKSQTNLVVSARFRGSRHMYDYVTTRLAGLNGIRSVETAPVIARFKQASPAISRVSS